MNEYLIASLERQWKEDPKSRVFLRLAEEHRKGGQYEKAAEICREGVRVHPNYVPALVCLGRCQRELGDLIEAEKSFNQVLKITPDNPHALRGLGRIFSEAGRHEEALPFFEALLIHEPMDEEIQETIKTIKERLQPEADGEDAPPSPASTEEQPDDPPADAWEADVERDAEPASDSEKEPSGLVGSSIIAEAETIPEQPAVSEAAIEEEVASEDDLDELDLEFERAISEADPADIELFEEAEDSIESELAGVDGPSPNLPGSTVVEAAALTADDEKTLTIGLKHEKKGHYEASLAIYRALAERCPGAAIEDHAARVRQLIEGESKRGKKTRLLSNWLDKIKGVYHVS